MEDDGSSLSEQNVLENVCSNEADLAMLWSAAACAASVHDNSRAVPLDTGSLS